MPKIVSGLRVHLSCDLERHHEKVHLGFRTNISTLYFCCRFVYMWYYWIVQNKSMIIKDLIFFAGHAMLKMRKKEVGFMSVA